MRSTKRRILASAVVATASGRGRSDAAAPSIEQALDGGPRPVMYVLEGGTTWIEDKGIFHEAYDDQGPITLEVRAFLVVHPDGVLLWDTGHSNELFDQPKEGAGTKGFRITTGAPLAKQLAEIGLSPGDVDLLAFSHWHYDHTGNANLFANATVIVQRDEYEYAFGGLGRYGFGMNPDTYDELANSDTDVLIGDRDVFDDGTVQILRVGWRTAGSQVLYGDFESTGPVLLSGDRYHFAEQSGQRRVPGFNVDADETKRDFEKVERFLRERPDTEPWITHDPIQMARTPLAPYVHG
ncbi:MAG: N-acyl homoserine lactonase family protein [Acidobacteriota bacterium]